MIARLTGAALRGCLMALLVAAPSLILPSVAGDTAQIVAFLAVAGLILIGVEYGASSPCLIEFRSAAPINRLRFAAILAAVTLMALLLRHPVAPGSVTGAVAAIGAALGGALDFGPSPVRLAVLALPADATPEASSLLRAGLGLTLGTAATFLGLFVLWLRRSAWPGDEAINIWVLLPTFDPCRGGNMPAMLGREERLSLLAAVTVVFLGPVAVAAQMGPGAMFSVEHPHALAWALAITGVLPLSLAIRGLALQRIATLAARDVDPGASGLVPL